MPLQQLKAVVAEIALAPEYSHRQAEDLALHGFVQIGVEPRLELRIGDHLHQSRRAQAHNLTRGCQHRGVFDIRVIAPVGFHYRLHEFFRHTLVHRVQARPQGAGGPERKLRVISHHHPLKRGMVAQVLPIPGDKGRVLLQRPAPVDARVELRQMHRPPVDFEPP